MKLKINSWHYKLWSSTFSAWDIEPRSTDLCRYCHRVFWALALRVFLGVVASVCLWMLGYGLIYKCLICHPVPTLTIGGFVAVVVGIWYGYSTWLNRGRDYSEPTTLVGKFVKASKDKVCPLVEFEN